MRTVDCTYMKPRIWLAILALSTLLTAMLGVLTSAPAAGSALCGWHQKVAYQHIVVVMEENKKYSSIVGKTSAPFLNSAIKDCATINGWQDAGGQYKSLPNYIALTSGAVNGITTDCTVSATCSTSADNVFRQLRDAGLSAKSYAESMPSNCYLKNKSPYAVRHVPAIYYTGGSDRTACQSDVQPFTQFDPNNLPSLAFVTPNLNDDMHGTPIPTADKWVQTLVGRITATSAWAQGNTAILILWDENTPAPNVIISPSVNPGQVVKSTAYGHYSALRFIEANFGLPYLGGAKTANDLTSAVSGL